MARVGLSKPYVALYNAGEDGTVTYSKGMRFDKAVKTSFSADTSEDNVLYADNGPAESDKQFAGGTLNVNTSELPLDIASLIYGLKLEEVMLDGAETATGKRITFGSDGSLPYLGYGVVVKKIVKNVPSFMAVIFLKIQFGYPGDDYETQGKSISWKTPELAANVLRDDTAEHNWRIWAEFASEADAEKYVKQVLNISDTPAA